MNPRTKCAEAVSSWARAQPRIRRVWLYGDEKPRTPRSSDIDVTIEMEPVADGDETVTFWIAHAEEWQAELERETGANVGLEWFDPVMDAPIDEDAVLAFDRTRL